MRDLYLIRCLCVFSVWLFSLGVAFGQQIDTTAYHELSGVEVVEKVRPSVTREGTPLQIMDRAGIDRLGVQDLSEAVKRFSGVTVQDYGGIGGLKTVSVRSLGAKHTAVSYDGVTIRMRKAGKTISAVSRWITWRWFPYRSDNRMTSSKRQGCMPRQEP